MTAPTPNSQLVTEIYDELRREARRQLRGKPVQTLQPTALLNEALLRLFEAHRGELASPAALYTYVAKAMRSVLVDHARERTAQKRGGGRRPAALEDVEEPVYDRGEDPEVLLFVHEALEKLAVQHPGLAELAELRFFGRLTVSEVAEAKQVSEGRVKAASLHFRRILQEAI